MERQLSGRVDHYLLRWFKHVRRIDEKHMAKKVMILDVEGNRSIVRPRLGWMEGVNRALGERHMSVKQGRQTALDRRRWEVIVRSE